MFCREGMSAGSEAESFAGAEEFGWDGKKFGGKVDLWAGEVVFALGPGRRRIAGVEGEGETVACGKERLELAQAAWNSATDGTAAFRWAPLELQQKLELEAPMTFLPTCDRWRLHLLQPGYWLAAAAPAAPAAGAAVDSADAADADVDIRAAGPGTALQRGTDNGQGPASEASAVGSRCFGRNAESPSWPAVRWTSGDTASVAGLTCSTQTGDDGGGGGGGRHEAGAGQGDFEIG